MLNNEAMEPGSPCSSPSLTNPFHRAHDPSPYCPPRVHRLHDVVQGAGAQGAAGSSGESCSVTQPQHILPGEVQVGHKCASGGCSAWCTLPCFNLGKNNWQELKACIYSFLEFLSPAALSQAKMVTFLKVQAHDLLMSPIENIDIFN